MNWKERKLLVCDTPVTIREFRGRIRFHKVTKPCNLVDAIALALNTREFRPLILACRYAGRVTTYTVVRELNSGERIKTWGLRSKKEGLLEIHRKTLLPIC